MALIVGEKNESGLPNLEYGNPERKHSMLKTLTLIR